MGSGAVIRNATLASTLLVASLGVTTPAHGAIALETGAETPRRIVVSIYKSEAAATEALRALKAARDRGELNLESHALVVKEANGKVKIREKRAKGTRSGQAVAAMTGVLGARGGVGISSTTAAATDYLTSNTIGMQKGAVDLVKGVLEPGDAAVVSAVDEKTADAAAKLQEVGSTRVLSHDLPTAISQPEGPQPSTPVQRPQVAPGSP